MTISKLNLKEARIIGLSIFAAPVEKSQSASKEFSPGRQILIEAG